MLEGEFPKSVHHFIETLLLLLQSVSQALLVCMLCSGGGRQFWDKNRGLLGDLRDEEVERYIFAVRALP